MVSELKIDLLKVQLHLGCSSSVIICIGKSGVIHISFMPTPQHRQQQGNVASFLTRNSDVSSSKCNWTLLQGFVSLVCLSLEEWKVILDSSETSNESRAICIETPIYKPAAWFAGAGVPQADHVCTEMSQELLVICHLAWKYL